MSRIKIILKAPGPKLGIPLKDLRPGQLFRILPSGWTPLMWTPETLYICANDGGFPDLVKFFSIPDANFWSGEACFKANVEPIEGTLVVE